MFTVPTPLSSSGQAILVPATVWAVEPAVLLRPRLALKVLTLNPTGTQTTVRGPVHAKPCMIAAYVDPKDFALSLHKAYNLNPNGRFYLVSEKPMSQGLLESF